AFIVCIGFRPPPGFEASLEDPLGMDRLERMVEERARTCPVVEDVRMQDPERGTWDCCPPASAATTGVRSSEGIVEVEAFDDQEDGGSSGSRWIAPFLACGDLSSFDSDATYRLPEDHVSLDPVQPPTAAPYKRAIELRQAAGGSNGKTAKA
ncbi:hypothetical protein IMZ48_31250, partial [Candidatus Bathyarchaeota archaeon]|nr:hypothetical protein [Candidatus Bathyarchaeota archaeon]